MPSRLVLKVGHRFPGTELTVISTVRIGDKIQVKCARPLVEWAEITGLARECIAYRLEKDWPVEEALTLPSGQELRMITYGGKTMSVAEWARELGVNAMLIYGRLHQGWSVEDALTRPVRLDRERAEDGRYC